MKSQELTKKAIEAICGSISAKKAALICKTCGKQHLPSQLCVEAERKVQSEAEEKARFYAEAFAKAQTRWRAQSEARATAEEKAMAQAIARAKAERRAKAYAEVIAKAEADLVEILAALARTADCECCGTKRVRKDRLVKIDSGQLLCPDCLKQLKQCLHRPTSFPS